MVGYRLNILGRVQGVFFRATAKTQADLLGIKGWVRNEKDGSVLIEAHGDANSLAKFKSWCESGPDFAKVSEVSVEDIDPQDLTEFEITY